MAFNFVEKRVTKVMDKVRSKNILNSENIDQILQEIRLILLDSVVNLKLLKSFLDAVRERANGEVVDFEKTKSQEIIDIINKELIKILGGDTHE